MTKHLPCFILLSACLIQFSSGFFWKVRLIYSTIHPEPSWDPELLEWAREQREFRKKVSLGQITGYWGEVTTTSSEAANIEALREQFIQAIDTKEKYIDKMLWYPNLWFRSMFNILGHKYDAWRLNMRVKKEWLTAKFFLRDPRAVKYMMNNVEINKFNVGRRKEYIRERWYQLFCEELPHYLSMMKRTTNSFLNHTYPDGLFNTFYNDMMGIENKLREEKRRKATTPKPTTTKIYNDEYFKTWQCPPHKKRK